jgi:HEAT repeat protein
MRHALILAVLLLGAASARADEADDALARRMVGVVKDFRQPLAARVEAARTLAKLGARASSAVTDLVAVLERIMGREQEPLQEALIEALGEMGAAARPALPALAKATHRTADIDLAVRRATEAIVAAGDDQQISALVQQLQSRDAGTRLRAAKSLGDLGPAARGAVAGLTGALTDTDGDVRRAAVTALRAIQPGARPTEALIRAIATDLRDPDANVRLIAARTLGRIGPVAAAAAPDLEPLRNDPDPDVRRAAAFALSAVAGPLP